MDRFDYSEIVIRPGSLPTAASDTALGGIWHAAADEKGQGKPLQRDTEMGGVGGLLLLLLPKQRNKQRTDYIAPNTGA